VNKLCVNPKEMKMHMYDEGSTIASALPSIATRRSVKSES
jgi:hypothetical protein